MCSWRSPAGICATARLPGIRPGLVQLVLTRFREFFREPEAVFWVYIFPILLATGLGVAFRQQPAERSLVGWADYTTEDVAAEPLRSALQEDREGARC